VFVPEHLTVERPGPDSQPVMVRLSIDVDAFASVMWRKILRDKRLLVSLTNLRY